MPIVTVTLKDSPTTPLPDTFVDSEDVWDNWGADEAFEVEEVNIINRFRRIAFLRFPIETIPNKADIKTAILKLRVITNSNPARHYLLKYLLSGWDEAQVIFATMPGRGDTFLDTVFPGVGLWASLDITQAVKDWYKKLRVNFGIVIMPKEHGSNHVEFSAKESGDLVAPRIEITYLINPARKEYIPPR